VLTERESISMEDEYGVAPADRQDAGDSSSSAATNNRTSASATPTAPRLTRRTYTERSTNC